MYGDFSRNVFDQANGQYRVLTQQGRPATDADWNREIAILNDREWRLIRSLLRADSGTFDGGFFPKIVIVENKPQLRLCPGSYYVEGLRCDLRKAATAPVKLPQSATPPNDKLGPTVLALDVWEQTVSPAMDATLLEPTLHGCDTAWRTQVAWRVSIESLKKDVNANCKCPYSTLGMSLLEDRKISLRRAPEKASVPEGPCRVTAERSATLGESLYRIEVHRSGCPLQPGHSFAQEGMTFKWSRDNGAAVYAIEKPTGTNTLRMQPSRFGSKSALAAGDRLELLDELGQSVNVDKKLVEVIESTGQYSYSLGDKLTLPLNPNSNELISSLKSPAADEYHVRRWNQQGKRPNEDDKPGDYLRPLKEGITSREPFLSSDGCCIAVVKGADGDSDLWFKIEGNLEIKFHNVHYEAGDYWLIRVSDIEPTGFVDFASHERSADREYTLQRSGGHYHALLGVLPAGENGSWLLTNESDPAAGCWNGKSLQDEPIKPGRECAPVGSCAPPAACPPPPQPATPPNPIPMPLVSQPVLPVTPASLLSAVGRQALAPLLASRACITRRIPARYLSHEPKSDSYCRFRAALLVSEIREPTFGQYLAKVIRTAQVDSSELPALEADARADYELAADLEELISSGAAARQMFA